jgi:hypothetical protein
VPTANLVARNGLDCLHNTTNIKATTSTTSPIFAWSGTSTILDSLAAASVGIYTVTVTDENNNCSVTASITIHAAIQPVATATIDKHRSCGELHTNFAVSVTPLDSYTYTWNLGDNTTQNTASFTHHYPDMNVAMVYPIYLTVNKGFCESVVLDTIRTYPQLTAAFETTTLNNCNTAIDFTNTTINASANTNYLWQFGDGGSSVVTNPIYTYQKGSGYYVTLIAISEYGCKDTMRKQMKKCSGLVIPNAFQPETTDSEARYFGGRGAWLQSYHLRVFSQWGNLLWETEALDEGIPNEFWDGTYRGTALPQGAYIWQCEAVYLNGEAWEGSIDSNGQLIKMGTVYLLR